MSEIDIYEAPDVSWSPDSPLGRLAFDALACEERRHAGVELPADDVRYVRIVRRLVDLAQSQFLPRVSVNGERYARLAERACVGDGTGAAGAYATSRGMAVFFRPEQLAMHVDALRRHAALGDDEIVAAFAACAGGVVLVPRIGGSGLARIDQASSSSGGAELFSSRAAIAQAGAWPTQPYEALLHQFSSQGEGGRVVNVGPFTNHQLAAAIHTSAFGLGEPRSYRLRFQDGSLSAPLLFPMLAPPEGAGIDSPVLRVALLSHRHLGLDHEVDMNWFRNAETSTGDAHTVIEQRCARVTEEQLRGFSEGRLHMRMKQTGLLPAVVGFYRGLLQTLQDDRGRFEVTVRLRGTGGPEREFSWR